MGCTASSPETRTDEEIVGLCSKTPGVKFSETMIEVNGAKRNTCSWVPSEEQGTTKPIKAVVFICHGLLEHSLCYYKIGIPLALAGYAVFGIDHASHGKSDGRRGVIEDSTALPKDFIKFCNDKRAEVRSLHFTSLFFSCLLFFFYFRVSSPLPLLAV